LPEHELKLTLNGTEPILGAALSKTLSLRLMLLTAAAISLVGCSRWDDDRLAGELAPPERVDVLSPPMAPDPSQMHPALQIARSRGLKTNVYFNEELQQAVARLNGMEETLGRLQGDLQGTAMAMQRVEMMRQEIDALNVRFQSIQERLMYAGPILAPAPVPDDVAMGMAPDGTTTVTTTTTVPGGPADMMIEPLSENAPTSLTDSMAKPAEVKTAQMKPVVDEKGAAKAAAPASTGGAGVNDVRFGTHGDTSRIVLDINGASDFKAELDSAENVLTVILPKTKWSATTTQAVKNNPLITSYSAQPAGDGSVVAFTLKPGTKLVKSAALKAPTRVMIDLGK
jgi:TolA-binding protein